MVERKIIVVTGLTGNQGDGVVRHLQNSVFKIKAVPRNLKSKGANKLRKMQVALVFGTWTNRKY